MKNYFKKLLFIVINLGLIFSYSCSKDDQNAPGGNEVYYVIEGIYDAIPDQPPREGSVFVNVSMTMPDGNLSVGQPATPYTSSKRTYSSGMTLTITAESILSYTTITVKIFRNGDLWKSNTAAETGFGNYATATVSGTL